MQVEKLEFPQEVELRLKSKIKQSIKMKFYNGAKIDIEGFNLVILEPHKVIFKNGNKVIIIYITVNSLSSKSSYNFFANTISKESKHSLNSLINIINENL